MARWVDREKDLKAMGDLRDDWDGMGARAVPSRIVEAAIQKLKQIRSEGQLPPPSAVSATPLGRVAMEWQFESGFLEAEFIDPFRIEWMAETGGTFSEWREDEVWEKPANSGIHSELAFAQ
jgi:hypothetical protein